MNLPDEEYRRRIEAGAARDRLFDLLGLAFAGLVTICVLLFAVLMVG